MSEEKSISPLPQEKTRPKPLEPQARQYGDAVMKMVNEIAQVAGKFVEDGDIGAISVIAVSPDGSYVGTHIIEKMLPKTDEKTREERTKVASRLQLLLELQKQISVLKGQLSQIFNE